MEINNPVKAPAIEYLWFALYAFAGFSAELIQGLFLKKMPLGIGNLITAFLWIFISGSLIILAQKKLHYQLFKERIQLPTKNHHLLLACVVIVIILTTIGFGGFKPVVEFQGESQKNLFAYFCRLLYYLAESLLILLTIAFGQEFGEQRFTLPKAVPAGGIILALTWGTIHFFLQGFGGGLFTMAFSLIAGLIYLLAKKDAHWSYLYIALAFIL